MSYKLSVTAALFLAFSLTGCRNAANNDHPDNTADKPAVNNTPIPAPPPQPFNDLKGLWLKGPVRAITMAGYVNPSAALQAQDSANVNFAGATLFESFDFDPQGFLLEHTFSSTLQNNQATFLRFHTDSVFERGTHMLSSDHAGQKQSNTRLNYWANEHQYYMTLINGNMKAIFGFYFNDSGKQVKADEVVMQGTKKQTNFERSFNDEGTAGYTFVEHNFVSKETDTVRERYMTVDAYGNPRKVLETHSLKNKPVMLRFYTIRYY